MKTETLRKVVSSNQLTAYALPKDILAKLKRFDDLHAYCVTANRPVPDAVRLFRGDWNTINNQVIKQSDKVYSADTVFYHGVPLIAHDDSPKPFQLSAS